MVNNVLPRLVTFDVTGTLLMTKLVENYSKIGLQHGVKISNSRELAGSFKRNFKQLAKEHPNFGRHSGLGWENWWRQIVYNVFKDQDERVSDETLDKVATSLIECYGTSKCWDKYPGAVEILEYLKSRGVVIGVISNFDDRLESILASTRIRPYFSFVLGSYACGVEKPDSWLFGEALKVARDVHGVDVVPEEALHIGDTLDNDYVGARTARWNALLVNHHNEAIDESRVPAAHQFTSLRQLQAHFDGTIDNDNES